MVPILVGHLHCIISQVDSVGWLWYTDMQQVIPSFIWCHWVYSGFFEHFIWEKKRLIAENLNSVCFLQWTTILVKIMEAVIQCVSLRQMVERRVPALKTLCWGKTVFHARATAWVPCLSAVPPTNASPSGGSVIHRWDSCFVYYLWFFFFFLSFFE